jgi:hypothetical protein
MLARLTFCARKYITPANLYDAFGRQAVSVSVPDRPGEHEAHLFRRPGHKTPYRVPETKIMMKLHNILATDITSRRLSSKYTQKLRWPYVATVGSCTD